WWLVKDKKLQGLGGKVYRSLAPVFFTNHHPLTTNHLSRSAMYEKIVLITLKTRLEELIERFNTREQAKFYIEHMGLNFADYDREHEIYTKAVHRLRRELEGLT